MRKNQMGMLLVGLALALISGCMDLDVVNTNQPDRERAMGQPGDVMALAGGAFFTWYRVMHSEDPGPPGNAGVGAMANLFPNNATEMTTTAEAYSGREITREPRLPLDNDLSTAGGNGAHGHRRAWRYLNEVLSSTGDVLRTIDENGGSLVVNGVDVTQRVRAYGKFMQGLAWGYSSLIFDQGYYLPEDVPIDADAIGQARRVLIPTAELRGRALEAIDEAIAIAQQHGVTFPSYPDSQLWFTTSAPMTTADFVQLANTMKARILVYHARNPAERRQVDWNRVLDYTSSGLTYDFGTVLAPGFRSSTFLARAQNNPVGCANCFRLDNLLIGQADVSGTFQTWLATPVAERNRFDIVTPDRRITGVTPQSHGAYTRYRVDNNGFDPSQGTHLFSAYQWARHAHRMNVADTETASNTGIALIATADENNLLRAEALLRTGNPAGAAALINITRTRSHTLRDGTTHPGLPPVTESGVPESLDCVPRTDDGACGDLMVALRYERMIEGIGLDTVRGWMDGRGFGLLRDGAFVEAPVPPEDIQLLGIPWYTFGGNDWPGAAYSPVTMQAM